MSKEYGCDHPTPNTLQTTLPTKAEDLKNQGSLKHPLPNHSKYGK